MIYLNCTNMLHTYGYEYVCMPAHRWRVFHVVAVVAGGQEGWQGGVVRQRGTARRLWPTRASTVQAGRWRHEGKFSRTIRLSENKPSRTVWRPFDILAGHTPYSLAIPVLEYLSGAVARLTSGRGDREVSWWRQWSALTRTSRWIPLYPSRWIEVEEYSMLIHGHTEFRILV
jgi:hypothetical protein